MSDTEEDFWGPPVSEARYRRAQFWHWRHNQWARYKDWRRHTYLCGVPILGWRSGGMIMQVSPKILALKVGYTLTRRTHEPGCTCEVCVYDRHKDHAEVGIARAYSMCEDLDPEYALPCLGDMDREAVFQEAMERRGVGEDDIVKFLDQKMELGYEIDCPYCSMQDPDCMLSADHACAYSPEDLVAMINELAPSDLTVEESLEYTYRLLTETVHW